MHILNCIIQIKQRNILELYTVEECKEYNVNEKACMETRNKEHHNLEVFEIQITYIISKVKYIKKNFTYISCYYISCVPLKLETIALPL